MIYRLGRGENVGVEAGDSIYSGLWTAAIERYSAGNL